ncbi:phage tail protein [Piscirickettsia litoralis]|uniref:Phage tail protein n=1 Tax=Piscirickettsia litoralis TaxID=1891921 RepID=A0ABX3A199_9GAMM|nr:phage tail protein [Piscirickettsia litoralis]ODN41180.1 hypothetical protein BGC07_17940 [Piscirickettsia litoralis]
MMKLGSFHFSVKTASYNKLQRKTSMRWAKNEPFGGGQSLQFLGQGEDSISLDGVIFPYYQGGLDQVDTMRKIAQEGKPLLLADDSKVHEYWVIEEVTETQSKFIGQTPQKIEFNLRLLYYGTDIQNQKQ